MFAPQLCLGLPVGLSRLGLRPMTTQNQPDLRMEPDDVIVECARVSECDSGQQARWIAVPQRMHESVCREDNSDLGVGRYLFADDCVGPVKVYLLWRPHERDDKPRLVANSELVVVVVDVQIRATTPPGRHSGEVTLGKNVRKIRSRP